MPPTHPTKNGTTKQSRRLSEVAKYLVLPSGIAATGFPAVAKQLLKMGIILDDWQVGLGRAMLAKRDNGKYAAGIGGVVLSTCRQVGKTFTIGAVIFALCVLIPRTTVLWTAHHTRTTDETFEALRSLARRPKVAPYVTQTLAGNGKQSVIFANGSRILFGAREHGFGRGIPGVTMVVFDEAQILSHSALSDMIPAANTVANPLVLFMGTPPAPKDPSEVFKSYRREALSIAAIRAAGEQATSNRLYIEIGADDDAKADDRGQWRRGNPSYPKRTPPEAMLRLRELLGDDDAYLREGLGVWPSDQAGSRLIPDELWKATGIAEAPDGVRCYAVAFSFDGSRLALAGAVKHDGGFHGELLDAYTGPTDEGIGPLADWLAGCWRETAQIALAGGAGAKVLEQALRERGVPARLITVVTLQQYTTACAMTWESLQARTFTHLAGEGQAMLDASVAVCDMKKRGSSGAWGWEATTADGDETPLEATSVALWAARTTKRRPGRKQVAF